MPYVSFAEFNVPDTQQAADFYKAVFDWQAQKFGEGDYLMVDNNEEPGTIGVGLDKMHDDRPMTVAVITVPSVDEFATKIVAAGGKIVVEKFAIPGQGHAAYFTDPGGLVVGIYEQDENVK
jgi:hypothetical protein